MKLLKVFWISRFRSKFLVIGFACLFSSFAAAGQSQKGIDEIALRTLKLLDAGDIQGALLNSNRLKPNVRSNATTSEQRWYLAHAKALIANGLAEEAVPYVGMLRIGTRSPRTASDSERVIRAMMLEAQSFKEPSLNGLKAFEVEAEALRTKCCRTNDDLGVEIRLSVAETLTERGNATIAQSYFKEAFPIYPITFKNPVLTQRAQHVQGTLFNKLGNYEAACLILQEVANNRQALHGRAHPSTLQTLHQFAFCQRRQSQHTEAMKTIAEVVELRQRVLGIDHPHTLQSRLVWGRQHATSKNFEKAIEIFKETAELAKSRKRPLTDMQELGDSEIATVEILRGNFAVAERLVTSVLARQVERKAPRETIEDSFHQIGEIQYARSQLSAARISFVEALKGANSNLPTSPSLTEATRNNLATVVSDLGDLDEALSQYKAIEASMMKRGLNERNLALLEVRHNIAATLRGLKRFDEAASLIDDVIKLRKLLLPKDDPKTLTSENLKASLLSKIRRVPEALALHLSLYERRSSLFSPLHPSALSSLSNYANTLEDIGPEEAVSATYEKAIQGREQVLSLAHVDTITTLRNYASYLYEKGNKEKAKHFFKRAVDASEKLRESGSLPRNLRQSFFRNFVGMYGLYTRALIETGEFTRAFEILELSRARTLLEASRTRNALQEKVLPINEAESLELLEKSLESASTRLAFAKSRGLPQIKAQDEVDTYSIQLQNKVQSLKDQHPNFSRATEISMKTFAEGTSLLKSNEVYVNFSSVENAVSVFWLDSFGKSGGKALAKTPNLGHTLNAYRTIISTPGGLSALRRSSPTREAQVLWRLNAGGYLLQSVSAGEIKESQLVTSFVELEEYISKYLLGNLPIEYLSNATLLISADALLAQIPFETLKAQGKYLIEKVDVTYTQSLSMYSHLQQRKATLDLTQRKALLAFGNPTYSQGANPIQQVENPLLRGFSLRNADEASWLKRASSEPESIFSNLEWRSLPGAKAEIAALTEMFLLEDGVSVFSGDAASKSNFNQLNLKGHLRDYKVLVFAGHGFVNLNNPNLSSIVLSQKGLKNPLDGYVTASELSTYALASDLLIVSACDSGVGNVIGGEGVLGIPFAAYAAGNVGTALSLWSIVDESTSEFVVQFLKKVKDGDSHTKALSQTKREFLSGSVKSQWIDPAYWAAFVHYGLL
jgi:CHAT domain-containing protein/tetratricopeptide (TPR) repeat protein